jgi:CDP-diacylglycerol--glycerol-3-phosphate 3-phosphatidyltransferase
MSRQIPNLITALRALAGPFVLWLCLTGQADAAAIIFVLAALTDGLDGAVARGMGTESALGALLDPIADKVLVIFSLLGLCLIWPGAGSASTLWLWIAFGVILVRDSAITFARLKVGHSGRLTVVGLAKAKTACEMIGIAMALTALGFAGTPGFVLGLAAILIAFAAFLSGYTGWRYLQK